MITWSQIEPHLDNLRSVTGGFTNAKRGLLTLDGKEVFIKLATDENTKKWIQKEIEVYRFLNQVGFAHCPQLLAVNEDNSGMCLEAFTEGAGWDWSNTYTKDRVTSALKVMDDLAALQKTHELPGVFSTTKLSKDTSGWGKILVVPDRMDQAVKSLQSSGLDDLAVDVQEVEKHMSVYDSFMFNNDSLTHLDVRGDNCAYNAAQDRSILVDWNWAGLGDYSLERNAFLVNVHKGGVNVLAEFADYLDVGALHFMTGFWLDHSSQVPEDERMIKLRKHQLESALTAYELYSSLAK